ncbi:hypothetical protein [Desulforhabdus amnigena]|jgi:hypothetical protein|uniref:Uncharacterized protein n=1 Tax=Desulforhabdus amnigena TaxID=40218 RepID=A0A9W6L889_9BACT|nr:hypothetical protein [Desulforhabdus amnigena]GLI35367.1 hypothetical protein DAMNIGENAA_28000 [Desulforhabdus amnigena]
MNINASSASSLPIEEKIRYARELFDRGGETLLREPSVTKLLAILDRNIAASQEAMVRFGIVDACRHCEEEEGGSCCGAGIENRYNPILLLMNLLMSRDLPEKRQWENSCFFLGENGCRLKARHILCINYLCLRVQKMLPPNDLIALQTITGEEMDTIFLLHETVKKILNKNIR